MPYNDPSDKCCEVTSSSCTLFTGALGANSWLTADCNTSLTTLIGQIDTEITSLATGVRIPVSEVKDADSCEKLDYTNIVIRPTQTSKPDYVNAGDIIKQMLSVICDLQDQVSIIYSSTQFNNSFFALELPDTLKNKFSCLNCEDDCETSTPTTFGDLLTILVGKILDYELKNSTKLNCADCGCVEC